MLLSSAPVGTLFRFKNPIDSRAVMTLTPPGEHLVVRRDPEDRTSGATVVHLADWGSETYVWDFIRDHGEPEVEVTGKGHLKTMIVREE